MAVLTAPFSEYVTISFGTPTCGRLVSPCNARGTGQLSYVEEAKLEPEQGRATVPSRLQQQGLAPLREGHLGRAHEAQH